MVPSQVTWIYSDPFLKEKVRGAGCRGYILPCEGAFVKMVEEMESLCVYGGINGNWQVAKI